MNLKLIFFSEDEGYFLIVTLLLLLKSTFLLVVKGVSKKKIFFSSLVWNRSRVICFASDCTCYVLCVTVTIPSLTKFLGLTDNHFFLSMVLRERGFALRSSAIYTPAGW